MEAGMRGNHGKQPGRKRLGCLEIVCCELFWAICTNSSEGGKLQMVPLGHCTMLCTLSPCKSLMCTASLKQAAFKAHADVSLVR